MLLLVLMVQLMLGRVCAESVEGGSPARLEPFFGGADAVALPEMDRVSASSSDSGASLASSSLGQVLLAEEREELLEEKVVFRCRTVGGLGDMQILEKDYSVECYVGAHGQYLFVAGAGIVVYALGVPIMLFYLLWSNRSHLHDQTHEKFHREIRSRLGNFFLQCECFLLFPLCFLFFPLFPFFSLLRPWMLRPNRSTLNCSSDLF